MGLQVDRVITSGVFALDGGEWQVDNNVWIIGDDHEVIVIDAAHDAAKIAEGVGGRKVKAIICTHGHNDHINAAGDLADRVGGAPILLHADDSMLWSAEYPVRLPDGDLHHGQDIVIGDDTVHVLHTPGHSPGGICLHWVSGGIVFSGDTLFNGGPGATGRSFSSFSTIIDSIRSQLFTLPAGTIVNTGHGDSTSIGAESPQLNRWIAEHK
jgi:glyoxylase-like metal-dependent hydrolase (beta-lactamase superfamily II)